MLLTPLIVGTSLAAPGKAPAKKAPPGKAPASQPAVQPPASQPAPPKEDPFARLRVVVDRSKLPPIKSIRVRDRREAKDRSREGTIKTSVNTSPQKCVVKHGRRTIGTTPLTMTAARGSTPMDVMIKCRGYMTLRTRLRRKVSRSYYYKLTPSKIR